MLLLIGLLSLNFVIAWLNCFSCGRIWTEAKVLGGLSRLLAWCGAVQAAIGFSSVFGFLAGALLHSFGYLPQEVAQRAAALWYLLVIVPAIGTGLVITIETWIVAFREKSILNLGVAAYNTFAQVHNMYGAIQGIPQAWDAVSGMFSIDSDDPREWMAGLALAIVVFALFSGMLLTAMLIKRYAATLPLPAPVGGRYA